MDSEDFEGVGAQSADCERQSARPRDVASDSMPHFKLIFSTVVALTVLALILNVLLAMFGSNSDQVTTAAEACSTTYKMGFGAIVGLVGGRAA